MGLTLAKALAKALAKNVAKISSHLKNQPDKIPYACKNRPQHKSGLDRPYQDHSGGLDIYKRTL